MSKVSNSLLEVWQWKEELYNEVKDLDLETAIKKRLDDSIKAFE